MEDDMLDYVTLRTKNLGQKAPSSYGIRENARAKAVRASYEFWSTGNEALLEQAFAETFPEHAVPALSKPATNGLQPSWRPGAPEKESK
jgi:hypothetical protein